MHRFLEFHDSELVSVAHDLVNTTLRVNGYVHQWERRPEGWRGTGWMQPVEVRIANASAIAAVATPVDVWSGELNCGAVTHAGGVDLPFSSDESVRLQLDLNDGCTVTLAGSSVVFEPNGDPVYVEELPDHFRPTDAV